jgi:hypothetical protein
VEAGAPWAEEYGWGYGNLLSVAVVGGDTYLSITRRANKEMWWENLLSKNDVPIGAWQSDPVSLFCIAGTWVGADGQAAMEIIRTQTESSPYVLLGGAETLAAQPARTELFEPPSSSAFPNGLALRSPALLVLDEHYGRFTVRNLLTGSTERPEPGQPYQELSDPAPIGDSVYYGAWTGNLASVWVRKEPSINASVLKDDVYSYDNFVTDGHDAVWLRGLNQIGLNQFEIVELFTSPIGPHPQPLQPKKMLTLPTTGTPLLSVGSGWIAVRLGDEDVRLYRISDGFERRLPQGVGRMWHGGQNEGLIMVDGKLWVKSVPLGAAGNDVRFIGRFEIDKLPTP